MIIKSSGRLLAIVLAFRCAAATVAGEMACSAGDSCERSGHMTTGASLLQVVNGIAKDVNNIAEDEDDEKEQSSQNEKTKGGKGRDGAGGKGRGSKARTGEPPCPSSEETGDGNDDADEEKEKGWSDLPSGTGAKDYQAGSNKVNGYKNKVDSFAKCQKLCDAQEGCTVVHWCDAAGSRYGECWGSSEKSDSGKGSGFESARNAQKTEGTPATPSSPPPRPPSPPPPPEDEEYKSEEVTVGGSKSKTTTATLKESSLTCPSVVNKGNWLGSDTYGDTFGVSVKGNAVTVTRTDSNAGWGMNLRFECYKGTKPTPAPTVEETLSTGSKISVAKKGHQCKARNPLDFANDANMGRFKTAEQCGNAIRSMGVGAAIPLFKFGTGSNCDGNGECKCDFEIPKDGDANCPDGWESGNWNTYKIAPEHNKYQAVQGTILAQVYPKEHCPKGWHSKPSSYSDYVGCEHVKRKHGDNLYQYNVQELVSNAAMECDARQGKGDNDCGGFTLSLWAGDAKY